ncbi:MAG: hypothetical protein LBS81_03040 [Endomicrobium sp.]|jgi:hypothetical protein|nr:hypothetical protein [Endomicrobium sp.]
MASIEMYLDSTVSTSQLGRYEIVKLALEWIEIIRHNEDCRKLTQAELINKALIEVVTNVATHEKIEEIQKKK